ncbi:hypothetical protein NX059_000404 [Plenodomus lindquistii]|nr:hypothetical protein NX059_000404 [Plenodomus lindquistii]
MTRTPPPHGPHPLTNAPLPLTKLQRMTYRIGRGETGVLTFEPYKSLILPSWRFKTPAIARQSSKTIYAKFQEFSKQDDFIGMDMCRKFLQMGMTRAKRYANHKGGRKYDKSTGEELEKSTGHEGMSEKEEASLIFKEVWERARMDDGYQAKKERFMKEQKEWDKLQKRAMREGVKVEIEEEDDLDVEVKAEDEELEDTGRKRIRKKPSQSAKVAVEQEVKDEPED